MQKQIPFLVSSLLLTGLFNTQLLAVHASQPLVLSQRQTNEQLNELLRRGREFVDAGNYEQAIATYQQAASLDRQNPRIFSGIGYLQARQGNFREAAKAYQQAIALDPNNAEFQYALGYSLANAEDNAGAATAYRRAIGLNSNNVNSYLGLGFVLLRQKDYD
ncbi:tetratricopeptide repeat protein, partial [Trichocoleus sp. ST-U3]